MKKVIIVEDTKIVALGLKSILLDSGYSIMSVCSNGIDLFEQLSSNDLPDVVLMDIKLQNETGIALCKKLKNDFKDIKVLGLSSLIDEHTVLACLRVGFDGYVSKMASKEELINAIKNVTSGKSYFSADVAHFIDLFKENVNQPKIDKISFSDRELEIIRLFAEGFSYKEIANTLFISVSTVDSHKYNIMNKIGTKNSLDIVKFAIREKLITI